MAKIKTIPVVNVNSTKGRSFLKDIVDSRTFRNKEIQLSVENVIEDIRENGDTALFEYTKKFDNIVLNSKTVRISQEYINAQALKVSSKLKKTIRESAKRIKEYHKHQHGCEFSIKTEEGKLSQIVRPLGRVAVYIPGGHTVYPSSVLMNVIPAKIAGVKEIVAVTPPRDGLNPEIAFALKLLNVTEVYQIGGAQAIASLAYGTKSIRSVDKIVGPGNSYVAMAKRLVYGRVDIDSIAGPSEVAIMADDSANSQWVAMDLLAQAEHGSGDETAICVTEDKSFAQKVAKAVSEEIKDSPVKDVLEKLPERAICVFVTKSRKESIDFVNELAPEHLQIMTHTARKDLRSINNASAIFIGSYTPVALGDYFVGTNHVLPTGSAARFSSPLGVESFLKRISVAEVTKSGLRLAEPHVSRFARAEGFVHHAMSAERRASE